MKLNKILMTAAIALVGVASANAGGTYTQGDLILGIYSTSSSYSLVFEVNLGSAADYFNGLKSGTIVNIKDELNSAFSGASWFSDSTFSWGVAALVNDGAVAGTYDIALGVPTTVTLSQLNQADAVRNKVIGYGNEYRTTNSTVLGDGVTLAKTDAYSIYSYGKTVNDFSTGQNVVNGMNSGASAHVLDLYDYLGSDAGTLEGTFTLSSNGDLSYLAAVPEPSTYAMLAVGALGLFRVIRRRSNVKA